MTSATQDLMERQARLLSRCADERVQATVAINPIIDRLDAIDRGLERLRRWTGKPIAIAVGIGILLVAARTRSLRGAGAVLGLLSTALRIRSLVGRPRGPSLAGRASSNDMDTAS